MKTDRELLELAARAAGVRHIEYTNDYDGARGLMMCDEHGRHTDAWSPLTDDGDALRLAVKLSLCVFVNGMFVHADCQHCPGGDIGFFEENSARHSGCIYTATRRAIVRAAAAIGEAM